MRCSERRICRECRGSQSQEKSGVKATRQCIIGVGKLGRKSGMGNGGQVAEVSWGTNVGLGALVARRLSVWSVGGWLVCQREWQGW